MKRETSGGERRARREVFKRPPQVVLDFDRRRRHGLLHLDGGAALSACRPSQHSQAAEACAGEGVGAARCERETHTAVATLLPAAALFQLVGALPPAWRFAVRAPPASRLTRHADAAEQG
jgi:hypothetical protein